MRATRLLGSGLLVCLAVGHVSWAQAAPPAVGVASGLVKLRPGDTPPPGASARLDAARNEFEPFQVWIHGGDSGVSGVTLTASELVGPGGASIGAEQILLYREGLYQVVVPSNTEGAVGPWPDALIPARDAYFREARNAFPFEVPAGELRAVWVEVFVPPDTPAGRYTGAVSVTGVDLPATSVPVELRVRGFALPSTASLKSAFGVRWNVCAAHLGSYEACGDAGTERFLVLYGRAALDHRLSLDSVVYYGPDGEDWGRFDAAYAPLLDGTAATRLAGARQTTLRLQTGDPAEMQAWHDHFLARGWLDRLFDYTCDEPPQGCGFDEIAPLAAGPHAAGLRTLVTTDIDEIEAEGLSAAIDIAVPIVNYLQDRGGENRRPDYDAFLALGPEKELWMYQSCMSHGCGDGCVTTDEAYFTGWPSMMIDASAVQNRAMEWLSFLFDMSGELYFETSYDLPTAWDDQCDFSGNGDGTLFYPGTPDRIGGSEHIPIESIRLKLVREGMEDYELLHLLCELGDCAHAHQVASALFPAPYEVTSVTPEQLLAARAVLADRIEELLEPTSDGGDGQADGADGGADAGDEGADAGDAGADAPAGTDATLGGGCGCGAGQTGSGGLLLGLFAALVLLRGPARFRAGSILLAVMLGLGACGGGGGGPEPAPYAALEEQVHELVNAERGAAGLAALQWEDTIAEAARGHSQDMATGRVEFGHDGFEARVAAIAEIVPLVAAAENVAWNQGYPDPADAAVQGWMQSTAGHRENILGDHDRAGVGVDRTDDQRYYLTQIFTRDP